MDTTLLREWKSALIFRIGEDVTRTLPDPKNFPARFSVDRAATDDMQRAYSLGYTLAVAYLADARRKGKRRLATSGAFSRVVEQDIRQRMPGALGPMVADALASTLSTLACIATVAPEQMPLLLARLDALDNGTLHRMAVDAVEGRDVSPQVFDGLSSLYGGEVA